MHMQASISSVKSEAKGDWTSEKGGFKMVFVENKVTRCIVGLQNRIEDPTIWLLRI